LWEADTNKRLISSVKKFKQPQLHSRAIILGQFLGHFEND